MVLDGVGVILLHGETMIVPTEVIQFQENVSLVRPANDDRMLIELDKIKMLN